LRHQVTKHLPYTPHQLFTLVGDVERYPEFLPWVLSMRTWNVRPGGEGVSLLDAEVQVGFSFLKERFATRVRRDAEALDIQVGLISGPFKSLANRWRFIAEPGGTAVIFDIDFVFKAPFLDRMLAANFHHAVDRLIESFEGRAATLYGAPHA
jgi:coenzyme Q-binding protein COQ10